MKTRFLGELALDATVDIYTGRPVVSIHYSDASHVRDDDYFTPAEAERMGAELVRLANAARRKAGGK